MSDFRSTLASDETFMLSELCHVLKLIGEGARKRVRVNVARDENKEKK
jgi:hypothetical protein